MKVIKHLFFGLLVLVIFSCENDDSKRFNGENNSFVRFFLLVDSNNNVLEFPEKNGNLLAKTTYQKDNLKTLKIPVAITTANIKNPINVTFNTSVTGIDNYSITPINSLSFTNEKRIDTIFIKLNERWDLSKNPQIKLELTSVSDANIILGTPNTQIQNKELTIGFKETAFSYLFNINRKEISGKLNETFNFSVLFPNGFIASDIENIPLFSQPSTFNYSVVRKPITKENEVEFTLTVNENINDDVSLNAFLSLLDIPNYKKGTNESLQINKPIKIDRDGNPAANFYNTSDVFYRLRGEYWRPDTDIPGKCEWFATNIFSVPVVVNKTAANAVFISDNNTPNNENDDIYHHRFKIGFKSSTGLGVNVFAIRSLVNGISSKSPGLTLIESIEFFPTNGNSTTGGKMAVIAQNLILIRTSDNKSFSVPISGSGTYKILDAATNLWRMDFEITYDFSQVNGTIITLPMVYNNLPGQPEPDLPNSNCYEMINL
ncbi:hypothetical protein [Polaribacter glomeratus]|uniref:Uncharacterized protein n=1 Tax=Polaribacter glomeratus TaxID=102 RepID=A0A2S7WHL3_9FLAO|nr:hypothetical protein [Polaribacter glomeratus]PQJ76791.1 hypothetical protein BTO16_13000 [Polaribacter glomeratus]TXD67369.1 hypothetical protein ESX12_01915 [Polaribacter glomeratus]